MTQTEIDKIAREYAEEMAKDTAVEELPNCLKNSVYELNAECMEQKLKWLLQRYCLVEKSKLREAYKDAQKDQYNTQRDFALTLAGRNRSAVLVELFPDIAKEVEDAR